MLSHQKCVSCHSQGKQPVQNTIKTKGGKHYEDRKITAKLRDAVPVCLMIEGEEVKRYKNIDLSDMLKEAEMLDFHFNVPEDGKITFEISYAQGALPEVFPEPRAKMTRAEKTAKAAAEQKTKAEENAPQEVTTLTEHS